MEADFSGYATKAGLPCTDGRTIMPGAFRHQDKQQVPLVWQHNHKDVNNVLGHAILEDRPDGTYAHCFLNGTAQAKHARELIDHKDIKMLSIWANELIEKVGRVIHGSIKEVSLVLAGANPGAIIDNIRLVHDGMTDVLEDEAIIKTGLEFQVGVVEPNKATDATHADGEGGETVADVYNTLTDKQKDVVHFMLGQVLEDAAAGGSSAEHGNTNQDQNKNKEGSQTMNVFEQTGDGTQNGGNNVLTHDALRAIAADAIKNKASLKDTLEAYCVAQGKTLAHGINDIETLFPEAKAMTAAPEFFKRRTEWVNGVLSGANKTPFSRVKTHWADLNYDEARAKGYIKGSLKKEEFFGTARRTTTPQTIYKKQKLDRDDILDITDFDVVMWMKGEMRLMLEEELARAILIGDGRAVDDEDKIDETHIRPIASDDEMFTVVVNVNLGDANSTYMEVVDAIIRSRQFYRGSGNPTFYTTETTIAEMLLLRDGLDRRYYRNLEELATELRVNAIVPVEVMETEPDIVGILVNMNDYTIGADKGGQTTLFDDFDIDYNQYKYLIETRVSGALTKLKSAQVVRKTASSSVLIVPNAPTFNGETGVVTIVATANVTYKDELGVTIPTGAMAALADGESQTVVAHPNAGFHFASSEDDTWVFTFHAD